MRSSLRRDAIPFAVALLAHGSAVLALRIARVPPSGPSIAGASSAEPVQEVAVDVEPRTEANEAPASALARTEAARPPGSAGAAGPRDIAAKGDTTELGPSGAGSTESPPLLFTVPSIGLDGQNVIVAAAPVADAQNAQEPTNAATKALRDGLRERDQEVGLGAEGSVVSTLTEATHESLAAERGRATFLAVVDTGGLVELRLLRSVGDGWDDARKRAARALAKKPIALRGAKRAELEIEVVSDVRLPSGAKVPVTPAFEESHVARSENVPDGTPGVVRTQTVARFDLADIGARGSRVVHTRLVRATYF
jgi:hypothetical protein